MTKITFTDGTTHELAPEEAVKHLPGWLVIQREEWDHSFEPAGHVYFVDVASFPSERIAKVENEAVAA